MRSEYMVCPGKKKTKKNTDHIENPCSCQHGFLFFIAELRLMMSKLMLNHPLFFFKKSWLPMLMGLHHRVHGMILHDLTQRAGTNGQRPRNKITTPFPKWKSTVIAGHGRPANLLVEKYIQHIWKKKTNKNSSKLGSSSTSFGVENNKSLKPPFRNRVFPQNALLPPKQRRESSDGTVDSHPFDLQNWGMLREGFSKLGHNNNKKMLVKPSFTHSANGPWKKKFELYFPY